MADIEYEIQGIEPLLAKVATWTARTREALRQFLERAGLQIEAEAKERSPVDTGRLRASFNRGGPDNIFVLDMARLAVQVGTNVNYAEELEYSDRRPRGVGTIPFFRPAVEAAMGRIEGEFLDELARALEQEWAE